MSHTEPNTGFCDGTIEDDVCQDINNNIPVSEFDKFSVAFSDLHLSKKFIPVCSQPDALNSLCNSLIRLRNRLRGFEFHNCSTFVFFCCFHHLV